MSFFDRFWWWGAGDIGPEKDFTMILGEGMDGNKKAGKNTKYGTGYERMTSPGREYMKQLHVEKDTKAKPLNGKHPEEESKGEDNKLSVTNKTNALNESRNSEADQSFNISKVFVRDRNTKLDPATKPTLDQISFYSYGPITKFIDSICKFPYENIPNADKVTVSKIAWGYNHTIVQCDNGMVFVCGENSQGQLGLDPKKFPQVIGLVPNEVINNLYEVIGKLFKNLISSKTPEITFFNLDIGWGSNHTVFMVLFKSGKDYTRKLLTCGYHGCLGVFDVNEDTHILQRVIIPDLTDYDKIEYLIWKFNSSAVLDDENNLYYWGDDFDGFRERVPENKKLFKQNIVDISFGFRHAVALLENGDVYTWGDGTYGEISDSNEGGDNNDPVRIRYFKDNDIQIIKVEAGWRHSIFLDKKGNVYGWGLTKGINHKTERISTPIKLEDISDLNWIDVFTGETGNVAINEKGIPYRWEGVTGKVEIIEDVGGRYISSWVVANRNSLFFIT